MADKALLIPGTADAMHLEQNVAAGDLALSADLDAVLPSLDAVPSRDAEIPLG